MESLEDTEEDQGFIKINPPSQFTTIHSEEQILQLLESYNEKHSDCCIPRIPVEELKVREIDNGNAYVYILESLWESRSVSTDFVPSPPPILINPSPSPFDIWEIPLPEDFTPTSPTLSSLHPFISRQTSKSIPNTERIVLCTDCSGIGIQRCSRCSGRGGTSCRHCNGMGRKYFSSQTDHHQPNVGQPQFEICRHCDGTGRSLCSNCLTGELICKACTGLRFIKQWNVLTVSWSSSSVKFLAKESTNNLDKRVISYIQSAKEMNRHSDLIFFEDDCGINNLKRIKFVGYSSIDNFSVQETAKQINISRSNGDNMNNKRVCQFKHGLGMIPLVKVIVEFKGKEFKVNIVGKRNKIFWDGGYPAKDFRKGCCCCYACSIT